MSDTAAREFIAHTLDEYGHLLPSQWKAHARAALVQEPFATPLGRVSRDPVAALALLIEACERGEKNLRPYLDAGHAAVSGSPDDDEYSPAYQDETT